MAGMQEGPGNAAPFDIFLTAPPGLEVMLLDEVKLKGFRRPKAVPGGVTLRGGWPEVWRANLWIRGAGRVLARIGTFPAQHFDQLEKRAAQLDWRAILRPDIPFTVEASCAGSRLYHSGAVAERIAKAIHAVTGAPVQPDAAVTIMVRMERDHCTLSVDTSGALLHRRGHKEAVNRAPMRETMASLFLRQCGYTGREPVLDPMCGSGTFVIEAAEIAAGLNPGRSRRFAFEQLACFDPDAWAAMRAPRTPRQTEWRFYGSDRDAGAIAMSQENAARAAVQDLATFRQSGVSEITPPAGQPGLVITNAPYGTRIGDKTTLVPLYAALGRALAGRFSGWRVGVITTERDLARATRLPFLSTQAPVPHGGLRVTLFQTAPLP